MRTELRRALDALAGSRELCAAVLAQPQSLRTRWQLDDRDVRRWLCALQGDAKSPAAAARQMQQRAWTAMQMYAALRALAHIASRASAPGGPAAADEADCDRAAERLCRLLATTPGD